VTFMANYLPKVSAHFFGEAVPQDKLGKIQSSVRYLGELERIVGPLGLILIKRNVIQQAISQYFHNNTGIAHIVNGRDLKSLEDENGRLKRLLADTMLDNVVLKDLLGKN